MRHFRTLLAALLAIVGATTGVAQTTYNLWLAGTQVTSNHLSGDPTSADVNVTGISGVTGTVKLRVASQYGIDSYRLYLENVTITNTSNTAAHKEAIYMSGVGTQIRLTGTNTVSSTYAAAIDIHSNLKKEIRNNNADDPEASLTATGTTGIYVGDPSGEVIESESYLLIGTALTAQGTNGYGIAGSVAAADGSSQNGLRIADANYSHLYQVKAKGTQGAVCHFSGLSYLNDMALVQPTGARFLNEQVCDAIGNPIAGDTWVVFEYLEPEPEPYAFIQGSILTFCYDTKRATIANQYTVYDIPDDGTLPGWANKTNVTQAWFTDSFDNYEGLTSTCRMFYGLSNLTQITGLDNLHTDNVTDMSFMFCDCSSLTSLDLISFNTSNVTKMGSMFRNCSALESLNVSSFNTSAIKTYTSGAMDYMFYGCSSLTQLSLINFTIGKYYLDRMFFGCSSLETIYCDKTWSPASSEYMFQGCTSLYSESSGLHYDSSKIGEQYANPTTGYFTLPAMAAYAILNGSTLTFYYDNLSTQRAGTMYTLTWGIAPSWAGNSAITTATFDESFANYHNLVYANYMFGNLANLTQINNLRYLNTENVTNMANMFSSCTRLTELDLSSFKTSAVTSMKEMFKGDSNLTTIYVGANWSTASVQQSTSMFTGCTSLVGQNGTTYDVSHVTAAYAHVDAAGNPGYFTHEKEAYAVWNGGFLLTFYYDGLKSQRGTGSASVMSANWKTDTNERPGWYNNDQITTVSFDSSFGQYHGLTYLGHMFEGMDRLAAINGLQYLNTENVTYMNSMFQECPALTALDLSHFNTANVTSMWGMFQGCTALTSLDLSSFNTAKVTNMQNMFWGCTGLQKLFLTDFTTPKNPSMNKMFYNCSGLIRILCNNTWTASSSAEMFSGCTHLVGGVGTAFTTDHIDAGYARPDGGTGNPGYFTEKKIQPYALYGPNLGLTFYYDDQKYLRTNDSGEAYAPSDYYDFPWSGTYPSWTPAGGETWRNINKVVFDSSFQNYTGLTSTRYMFYGMNYLTTIEHLDYLNTEDVTDMSHMFEGCVNLQTLDTYNISANSVTDLTRMFYGCARLTSLNLQNFNPQQATKATSMFQGCSALTYIYSPNNWKTAKLTNSTSMFTGCTSLRSPNLSYNEGKIDVSYANPTTGYFFSSLSDPYPYAVLSADQKTLTFYYNTAYRWAEGTVYFMNWGDGYPGWTSSDGNETIETVTFDASFQNYHGLTSCYRMFRKMLALTQFNHLDYLNTENVNNMSWMFEGCVNLQTLDAHNLSANSVTNMEFMFDGCSSLTSLNLENFNPQQATSMSFMLRDCSALTYIYCPYNWKTSKLSSSTDMFLRCTSLRSPNRSYDKDKINASYANPTTGYFFTRFSDPYPYAVLSSDKKTLTFYYNNWYNNNDGTVYFMRWGYDIPGWTSSDGNGTIETVTFHITFKDCHELTSCYRMFYKMSALTQINHLDYLNTENVKSMYYMFYKCSALTSLDVSNFNTENVTEMSSMFSGCSALTSLNLSNFNTANVYGMEVMFDGCTSLTSLDVSNFNTENVTDMNSMFRDCKSLARLNLSNFDTGKVIDMHSMFHDCNLLWSLDVSNFNTENVTTMSAMFRGCSKLTSLDLSSFNTEKVTRMFAMFYGCSSLQTIYCNDDWNTSTVEISDNMFIDCTHLVGGNGTGFSTAHTTVDYAHPDAAGSPGYFTTIQKEAYAVVSTDGKTLTFYYDDKRDTREGTKYNLPWTGTYPGWAGTASAANTTITTATFDISFRAYSGLTNASRMFNKMTALTQINHLDYLNTANVTTMAYMFNECSALQTLNLSHFNTANVTVMSGLFYGCYRLTNLDLSHFDTENVTNMTYMFSGCSKLSSLDLSSFNTSNVTNMAYMFNGCSSLTSLDLSNFDTGSLTYMSAMFRGCSKLTSLDLTRFDTEDVTNMSIMFYNCSSLQTIYCNDDWNRSTVVNSSDMFSGCTKLVGGYGTTYDANNVTAAYAHPDAAGSPGYFTAMVAYAVVSTDGATLTFYYDDKKDTREGTKYDLPWTGQIPGWAGTSSAANTTITTATFDTSFQDYHGLTNTSYMFNRMTALTQINHLDYLATENVTDMKYMFNGCSALQNLDVTDFDTGKVTDMYAMFAICSALTSLDVSHFNTANVTNMNYMFSGCSKLSSLDVSNFNTANVTRMSNMFSGCSNLTNLNVSNFNTENLTTIAYMFYNCSKLQTIYCNDDWNTSTVTNSNAMFSGCTNLVGVNGTAYDANNVNAAYAHPDAAGNPGYFTATTTAYALLSTDGATLTFYYDNLKDTRAGTKYGLNTGDDVPAWNASKGTALHVVFDASFADARPTTTYSWFDHFEILTDIQGLENLNTENVTNMHGMFNGCYKLTTLDLSGFDTHNVTDMGYLFYACMELTTIYVGEGWDMSRVTDSIDMFPACFNLVGGAGTAYDGVHFHGDYAHIDGGTANPGYFSAKSTYSVGDVNKDGKITIADVTALVNIILGKTTTYEQRLADVNKDNKVTIADVTALVNIILGK